MKTYTAKPGEIQREWFLVDAEGQTLGRLATRIADTLRGKGKPVYTPHVDTGDFVVVVNAEKIAVTGSKLDTKIYYRHTGLPRRDQAAHAARAARAPSDRGHPQGGQGDAPEEQARVGADHEAEDLRRSRPSARRAGAEDHGARVSEIAQYLGTGKRKTSVARVILRPGDGQTWINGRTLDEYFPRPLHRKMVLAPLEVAEAASTYDLRVRVAGGGPSGQAGAIRHGIARALVEADPEMRIPLKRQGFLTRDARIVERKKAGLHKARKAPQFSKR